MRLIVLAALAVAACSDKPDPMLVPSTKAWEANPQYAEALQRKLAQEQAKTHEIDDTTYPCHPRAEGPTPCKAYSADGSSRVVPDGQRVEFSQHPERFQ